MKKLMLIVAGMMMAGNAMALAVNWNSGFLMKPDDAGNLTGVSWNGGTSKWVFDNAAKITTAGAVEAFVWESTTDLTFASGDLYKWYADGKQGTPFTGITALTGSSNTSAGANVASAINWTAQQDAYAAILYVYTDGDTKWYQENDVYVKVGNSSTSLQFISDFVGGGTLSGAGQTLNSWQSVPEPTSGLLLLLGVAGLALRRRRA